MRNLEALPGGFVPTEYTSQNGQGVSRIRRCQGGWVVVLWECEGHENKLMPTFATLEEALVAWAAEMHRPDNDQQEF